MWRRATVLRPANDDDWKAMFGVPPPGQWFGVVRASDWLVEGIGAIYFGTDGRWWLSFKRCPGITKLKTAHSCAKRLLSIAREQGIVVHAIADPAIPGGERWLNRLGFNETEEKLGGLTVWKRHY